MTAQLNNCANIVYRLQSVLPREGTIKIKQNQVDALHASENLTLCFTVGSTSVLLLFFKVVSIHV